MRDFHTIDVEGLAPDAVETGLAEFESEAAPALERIIAARSIANDDDFGYVIGLMAMFAAKNPTRRENWREAEEQVLKRMLQLATETPERWESELRRTGLDKLPGERASYEEARDFARGEKFQIKLATERHLELELQSWARLADLLARRNWVLLRAPVGVAGFVTTDHPVCLQWSDPSRRGDFHGPGYGLAQTEVVFPLSNELALVGTLEGAAGEVDVDELVVATVNTNLIGHARRQIYARAADFPYVATADGQIRKGSDLLADPAFLKVRETADTDDLRPNP